MEYNFRIDAIRWQMSTSANVIFYIFIFAMRTSVTDRQKDANTHTETAKPMAIGEILQICLKTMFGQLRCVQEVRKID